MTKENENKKLAEKGLKAAQTYLKHKGYEVVDVSYKCTAGEIDVVSKFEGTLVFTSVSVYRNDQNRLPQEKITAKKRQKIESIMGTYLAEHDYVDMNVRWDNLSILVVSDDKVLIRYHVNALGPTEGEE